MSCLGFTWNRSTESLIGQRDQGWKGDSQFPSFSTVPLLEEEHYELTWQDNLILPRDYVSPWPSTLNPSILKPLLKDRG